MAMMMSPLIKLSLDSTNTFANKAEIYEVEHDNEKGGRRIISNKEPKTIDVSSSPSLSASIDVLFSLFKSATLASFPFCQHDELPAKPVSKFAVGNKNSQLREQRRTQQLQKLLPQKIELLDVNLRQISALGKIADILRTAPFELVGAGEGETGTLFVVCSGEPIAVFKPIDSSISIDNSNESNVLFLPSGLETSDAPVREVGAYLMDDEGLFGVPATSLAKITHPHFSSQGGSRTGSIQEFVPNDYAAWDKGVTDFPVEEVLKIAILDLMIFNCDRHGGNILVIESDPQQKEKNGKKKSMEEDFGEGEDEEEDEEEEKRSRNSSKKEYKLIPIDQGFSLPDHIVSDIWFEWLNWRQSKQPIPQNLRKFVESIDIEHYASVLRGLRIKPKCIRVMKCSSLLLKKGVESGLTLFEIGQMCVSKRSKKQNEPSDLERLVQIATEREQQQLKTSNANNDPDAFFISILSDLIDIEIAKKNLGQFEQATTTSTTSNKQNLLIVPESNNNKKRTSADSQQSKTKLLGIDFVPPKRRSQQEMLNSNI